MDLQSLFDFRIPPQGELPPIPPLSLVPKLSDHPQIIFHFDLPQSLWVVHGDGIVREEKNFTHVNVTLRHPDKAPVTTAFGPKCFVSKYEEGEIRLIHPVVDEKDKLDFTGLVNKPDWQKVLDVNLRKRVAGEICNEAWRYADSHLIVTMTDRQFLETEREMNRWMNDDERLYQIIGLAAANCGTYATSMGRAGGGPFSPIRYLCPWPVLIANEIERNAKAQRARKGVYYVPRAETALMFARARDEFAPLDRRRDSYGDEAHVPHARTPVASGMILEAA